MSTICNYLEIHSPDDIRIAGTRVGIEHLLSLYLDGHTAESLALQFPTLSLEQIHGTIAYYWGNRTEVDEYLARWRAHSRKVREEQAAKPMPEVVQRIRKILEQRGQL